MFSRSLSRFLPARWSRTSVLALSWWQRMLLALPLCLLLWSGVLWALGGD